MFPKISRALFPQFCVGGCGCVDTPLCATCLASTLKPGSLSVPEFRSVEWLSTYSIPLTKTIVTRLKFYSTPLLASVLSPFLAELLPPDSDLAVPVPLHPLRQRMRGYNQAELLCQGFPIPTVQAVSRGRWTKPQSSLSAEKRKTNLTDAFFLSNPEVVQGKRAVIIDDVFTTGSTARACAELLKNAGAISIDVRVFAKS